jgi:4-hydroxybenzoate polyprenyltransferase
MNKLTAFLKLIRIQNLLMIALLMYFVRYFLIMPAYRVEFLDLQTDSFTFLLFVLGYILLTAGGYSINDYYDIGMDEINRPNKTILRNELSLSSGRSIYFILTAIGLGISLWAILRINAPKLIFVLAIVTLLYWFYTTKYKREFLTGNIAVSILAAIAVGLPWLYEFFASIYKGVIPFTNLRFITNIVLSYAAFAFILTFIREIIKDIADMEGDMEFECKSIPLVLGIPKTHILLHILQLVLLIGIALSAWYFFSNSYIYMLSFTAVLIILMIYFSSRLMKAKEKKDYLHLSDLLKVIFLAGIISIQLFSLEIRY